MLSDRGFEVVETRFCMRYFFRFILANWAKFPFWCPRIVIRAMGILDRLLPLGPPMDLLILARLTGQRVPDLEAAAKGVAQREIARSLT
jgi:hypothetical protein